VAAAILHNGRIWTGRRHAELISQIIQEYPDDHVYHDEQGFWTDDDRFVMRTAAAAIAVRYGQLPKDFNKTLLSEYLW